MPECLLLATLEVKATISCLLVHYTFAGLSTLASAGLGNTMADVIGVSAASGIEVRMCVGVIVGVRM
jgi:hypothetical protein